MKLKSQNGSITVTILTVLVLALLGAFLFSRISHNSTSQETDLNKSEMLRHNDYVENVVANFNFDSIERICSTGYDNLLGDPGSSTIWHTIYFLVEPRDNAMDEIIKSASQEGFSLVEDAGDELGPNIKRLHEENKDRFDVRMRAEINTNSSVDIRCNRFDAREVEKVVVPQDKAVISITVSQPYK